MTQNGHFWRKARNLFTVQKPNTYIEDQHTFLKSWVDRHSLFQIPSIAATEQSPNIVFKLKL